MIEPVHIGLSKQQHQALYSLCKIIFFIGGLGCGKNFIAALWLYNEIVTLITEAKQRLTNQTFLGLITAPVMDTLNFFTLPVLKDVWGLLGWQEDVHYVINREPPKEWNVKGLSSLRNTRIMSFIFGGNIILSSTENYNKMRGAEFDFIYSDEWRDQAPESNDVLFPRLRGKLSKEINKEARCFITSTMPDDATLIDKYVTNPELNCEYVKSVTKDNLQNLPDGYLGMLQSVLDPQIYRREVLGEDVRIGNYACWNFDKVENVNSFEINNRNPIYIIYDFDYNPQVALILQTSGFTTNNELQYTVVKEYVFRPGNTVELTQTIIYDLIKLDFNGEIYLTGDYSGNNKSPQSNYTSWQLILNEFKQSKFSQMVRKKLFPTKSVRNNLNCLNALWNNMHGDRRLFVNRNLKYTIDDCINTHISEQGRLEHTANNERSHAVANLGDFAKIFNPISSIKRKVA